MSLEELHTFLASFSAFCRSFSSFFRRSAELSFFLFSAAILSSAAVLLIALFVFVFVVPFPPAKYELCDVDGMLLAAAAASDACFPLGVARCVFGVIGFLIGATLAVMPNFDTVDGCELDDTGAALLSNGTVSSDDVDDADFDFCAVYEANLRRMKKANALIRLKATIFPTHIFQTELIANGEKIELPETW